MKIDKQEKTLTIATYVQKNIKERKEYHDVCVYIIYIYTHMQGIIYKHID